MNFFRKYKEIIVLDNHDFTQSDAEQIRKDTGRICILVTNLDSIKLLSSEDIVVEKGDITEKDSKKVANIKAKIIKRNNDPVKDFTGEEKK